MCAGIHTSWEYIYHCDTRFHCDQMLRAPGLVIIELPGLHSTTLGAPGLNLWEEMTEFFTPLPLPIFLKRRSIVAFKYYSIADNSQLQTVSTLQSKLIEMKFLHTHNTTLHEYERFNIT